MKRIFLDTNYMVRHILKDQSDQGREVNCLIQDALDSKVFLTTSQINIIEAYWVLIKVYKFQENDVLNVLETIYDYSFMYIEGKQTMSFAIEIAKHSNIKLVDAYSIAHCIHNDLELATFDKKMNKIFQKLKN